MPETSRVLMYAELLSNIRQISVGCSLSSPCSTSTSAGISADGKRLIVSHDGEESTLGLPAKVAATRLPPIQPGETRSLSWRLPLASAAVRTGPTDVQTVPWSASGLQPGCSVNCRKCKTAVVDQGSIKVWKDLPSENWAEMMEFWHCHKPDDHNHDHDRAEDGQHLAGRGYGASSRISGQTGTGFVDLTSFLLSETDCKNLKMGNPGSKPETQPRSPADQTTPVSCRTCNSETGVLHNETASITLYKWQLIISSSVGEARSQPKLANCVASMLISTLSRSGCSKSVILPTESSNPASSATLLHIWLFNGNISFTSSARPGGRPVSAVKVLYRLVSKEEADRMSESMTSEVQDISLPTSATESLKHLLAESNGWLPEGDRKFKEWTVGLLEKWEG